MTEQDSKQLLDQLKAIEDELRSRPDIWTCFSRGYLKEAHQVLGAETVSLEGVLHVFDRFLDERMLQLYRVLNDRFELRDLQEACKHDLELASKENYYLKRENESIKRENESLKREIEILQNNSEELKKEIESLKRGPKEVKREIFLPELSFSKNDQLTNTKNWKDLAEKWEIRPLPAPKDPGFRISGFFKGMFGSKKDL